VAQIAMLRHNLVDDERWITSDRFNRTLAVYQVLPGPEAQELCIYFGTLARGRLGGLLAGLAFMLPGFGIMLGLAWFYVEVGIESPLFVAALGGAQAAVLALILRGLHRIGSRALHGWWLPAIALIALALSWLGVHFAVPLATGGLAYLLVARGRPIPAMVVLAAAVILGAAAAVTIGLPADRDSSDPAAAGAPPSSGELLVTGLQAGSLTFGGAYTAIPFVQDDAVRRGGWMTNDQFLDGLALSGTIPAPLIIFGTFIGYLAGGVWGAVAITGGLFLPAFAMTLLGHRYLEAIVDDQRIHAALYGVTAGVVGLVAATVVLLLPVALTSPAAAALFVAALAGFFRWRSSFAMPVLIVGAGLIGLVVF
jgi:chromate transporter